MSSDVRYSPESRHWNSVSRRPLCANSGHKFISAFLEISLDSRQIFQYLLKYEEASCFGGFGRSRAGQSS
jgi:hypothetical protein